MATYERRNIYRRLAAVSEDLRLRDIREALEGLALEVPHFVLQQGIDGPFALTGLLINGESVLAKAIPSSKRSIGVPVNARSPFRIRWSARCFQNQPLLVGYYVTAGSPPNVRKLEEKRGLAANQEWNSKSHDI